MKVLSHPDLPDTRLSISLFEYSRRLSSCLFDQRSANKKKMIMGYLWDITQWVKQKY